MQMRQTVVGFVLLAGALSAQVAGRGGTISGKILDGSGKDFGLGAQLLALRRIENTPKAVTHTGFARAGRDGSYVLSELPAGNYDLCVTPLNGEFVDECEWGRPSATVAVLAGGTSNANIRLNKGVLFWVELEDKEKALEKYEGKSPGGYLNLGVITPGNELVRMKTGQEAEEKKTYWIVAPVATRFRLEAKSPLFDLVSAEDTGETIEALQGQREFSGSEAAKRVKLRVRGIKTVQVAR